MIHYGDITKIKGSEVPKVDIITGGSPCQDLSVAGKREGLAGERSGLFMEQIRIVKEMREYDRRTTGRADEYIRPRFMVWENVPGAFSSNKGEDFRVVLEEICRIKDKSATIPEPPKGKWQPSGCIMGDGWSVAWRVHDAQFWGVPQRRKRISLVADFGGLSAPEILFERKGLSGDSEQSGSEREGITTDVEGSIGETIGFNRERCGAVTMNDAMPTLQAAAGESGNNQPMVALSFQERAGKPGGGKGILIQDEHTGALSTLNNQPVCYRKKGHPQNAQQGQGWEQTEINDTLNAFDNGESRTPTVVFEPGAVCQSVVRRLTPLECERLQGYPDGWTDIGDWVDSKGKKHKGESDNSRYKALGNSIALPFWQWMAQKMVKHLNNPTMASLFDGIGGFPLVYSRCGCKPIWASEIEEFPIAVTKLRFMEVAE